MFFIKYLFQREEGRGRKREASVMKENESSYMPPTGYLACNPGMCLPGSWVDGQLLGHTGWDDLFLKNKKAYLDQSYRLRDLSSLSFIFHLRI